MRLEEKENNNKKYEKKGKIILEIKMMENTNLK